MPKYAAEMEQIFDAVFAGTTVNPRTGKLVESDPKEIAKADQIVKGMLEKVAKEKWLMKESADDSLSHMAGLINFEELNAGASSLKTTPTAKAPTSTMGEAAKPKLGFGKVFENLSMMQQDDGAMGVDGGDEVIDGNDSFDNAQMGAGDEGQVAGNDGDLSGMDDSDPAMMSGDQGSAGDMGGVDMAGGDFGTEGDQMDLDGQSQQGDNPLDFDLSDLSSFDDLGGDRVANDEFVAPTDGEDGLETGPQPGQQGALA